MSSSLIEIAHVLTSGWGKIAQVGLTYLTNDKNANLLKMVFVK